MRLSLRSGQTHFVPASCRRLSADSRLPWHLTWSIALFGSCTAWDLPAAWAARGAARRAIVPCCQTPGCLQALSHVSQAPHLPWHTGHPAAWCV